MWKKKLSLLLAAALVLTVQPGGVHASAAQWGGITEWAESLIPNRTSVPKGAALEDVSDTKFSNGTNGSFSWSFQAADGVLTIKGLKSIKNTAIMADYTESTCKEAPWMTQATDTGNGVKKIVFQGTVQAVGAYSFYELPNVEEVDFSEASSLTTLGMCAFSKCGTAVKAGIRFTGTDKLTTLGNGCFSGSSMTEIALPAVTILPQSCFASCKSLEKVEISGLQRMGESCFEQCSKLKASPDLSKYTGTALPKKAFSNASVLASVPGLAENTAIVSLEESCLQKTALREVTLPVNTKTLGASALEGTGLEELPGRMEQVTTLGSSCFSGTAITEAVIPKSVIRIDGNVFNRCSALKRVTIEEGSKWTTLSQSMFSGCEKLEQIVFPEKCGVTSIGLYAFSNCTSLTSLTFPSGITSVGEKAFAGDKNLLSVTFTADEMKTLHKDAFEGCSALKQILIYGSTAPVSALSSGVTPDIYVSGRALQQSVRNALSSNAAYAGDTRKPAALQKVRILTEEDKTRKSSLLAIKLEQTIMSQEDIKNGKSFAPEVTENTSSRQDIQYCYFTDSACTELYDAENITAVPDQVGIYYVKGYLPENAEWFPAWSNSVYCRVEGVRDAAFYSYDTVNKKLVIKDTVDNMLAQEGDSAKDGEEKNFTGTNQLPWSEYYREIQSVEWADGVQETRIGDYMFNNHYDLKQITLPEGIEKIGKSAFSGCSHLKTLHLPDGVKYIGENAIGGAFDDFALPAGLETIAASGLSGLHLTGTLQIPASVTELGEGAFRNLKAANLVFPEDLQFTQIPAFCFAGMDLCNGEEPGNDKLFQIPDGITSLGESAFMDAKLTKVIVPASVTKIEKSAFQGCSNLRQVALMNENYTMSNIRQVNVIVDNYSNDSIFAGTPGICMICCDGATYELLKDASTYNYGRKLYSAKLMEKSLQDIKQDCDAMEETDYPAEAWTAFDDAYTGIEEKTGAQFESVMDKVVVLQQAEKDFLAAVVTLLEASVQDAGSLKEEEYTADSWIDFYYAYDELHAYFETYGNKVSKDDLSYLVGVNAEMAGYRRMLEPVQGNTPAPGQDTPAPGQDNTPAPGQDNTPAPGQDNTPAPGQDNTPAPGQNNTPAPGQDNTPAPGGNQTVTLKKPAIKKIVSKKKKKVSLQWKKVANASGYQVAYGYKKNMKGAKTATIKKAATVQKTIGGLKSKKTCYFRVRAWADVDGKKVYSSWSAVKKVKVK